MKLTKEERKLLIYLLCDHISDIGATDEIIPILHKITSNPASEIKEKPNKKFFDSKGTEILVGDILENQYGVAFKVTSIDDTTIGLDDSAWVYEGNKFTIIRQKGD